MMSEVAAADLGKIILKIHEKLFRYGFDFVFFLNRQMQKANRKQMKMSWISMRHSRDLVMMNAHASRSAFIWKIFSLFKVSGYSITCSYSSRASS
jgi:hypothetical protein